MNADRITILADAIEDAGPAFNMAALLHTKRPELWDHDDPIGSAHECGAVAGIAGWTLMLFDHTYLYRPQPFAYHADDIRARAAYILGLDETQAALLFTPNTGDNSHTQLNEITPYEAADTLRHLADTETVQWQLNPMWHATLRTPEVAITP